MSILIIALPRTGSTRLCTALTKALGYSLCSFEPFNHKTAHNFKIDFSDITSDTPVVIKTMIEQFPKSTTFQAKHPDIFDFTLTKSEISYRWNREFLKRFRHVVLLDRKDIYDQCVSLTTAVMRSASNIQNEWHKSYRAVYDEEKIKECMERFNVYKSNLELISKETNIPVTYYEDLYHEYRIKRLRQIKHLVKNTDDFNKEIYLYHTDPKLRYRKLDEPKKLL